MRWVKAGCGVLAAYTAPGAGYPMSPAELYDPVVRAFSHTVLLPCTIFNDLVSVFKERAAGQAHVNLVSVLAAEHDLSTTEALIKAGELYERLIALMLRLQQQLLSDPRPAVARYARELPQWVAANLHWTATSLRFLALNHAGATAKVTIPTMTTTRDTPLLTDATDLTPPPYPDLAWLWQHLAE